MGDYSKIIEQSAKKMPEMQEVKLLMTGLHLHANGVFSNVYRGILLSPGHQREIAIKKTWPKGELRIFILHIYKTENKERNFEMVFLTGINRKKHKNIVQMLFAFTKTVGKNEARPIICESFVFDFMPDTLASMIKKDLLNIIDIKLYTWQLFNGLLYLSSHYIVHRDIKPVNILVDYQIGLLKIGDFGSAKIVRKDVKSTCYQVTRFYRPPELLLESQYYKWTSDLWSGGCVVGEMLRQNVLFPGKNRKEQLRLIFNCLGSPTKDEIKSMKTPIQLEGKKIVGYGLIRQECSFILLKTGLEEKRFLKTPFLAAYFGSV
uniref:Protein kinase domain-containing protein n=1 Tax=Heterorhabditis bacteriophora TaxID=37862 RepID=A0A1I7XQR7_HETBA